MKFNPVNSNFVFDLITTPNKNIQSYFMRSEQSFLTNESLKYPSYPSQDPPIQFILLDSLFIINSNKIEQDYILNSKMNIKKYKTIQKCLDLIYSSINNHLKDNKINKTTPIQLIIPDFLGRSDIIALIDIIMNSLGFKAIMILPISICLSIHLNQNYSAFIYNSGFSFIDDFCLIDALDMSSDQSNYLKIRIDDEDFAEEYSRLSLIDDNFKYSCDECGQKEDSVEKIQNHISKEHQIGSYFEYVRTDDFKSNFINRMKYLFNKEKLEKISKKIYSADLEINIDEYQIEKIDNPLEMIVSGAQIFFSLDCSKDLWMTDFEWRSGRIRILKEKLLFYI